MIGHLRHELGHYYWEQLIGQTELLDQFRDLFGDERQDYAAALDDHYQGEPQSWSQHHISAYAAVHPHEDWAESFAHFLHIQDAWETAREHGLVDADNGRAADDGHRVDQARGQGLPARPRVMIESWLQVAAGINDLAAGLGTEPLYPFSPSRPALDKIVFTHTAISRRIVGSPAGGVLAPPSQ